MFLLEHRESDLVCDKLNREDALCTLKPFM